MSERQESSRSNDIGLLNIHMSIINSERSTIWQRYSALLITNSVVLVFLENNPDLPWVGLILCIAWFFMHLNGYRRFVGRLNTVAEGFSVTPDPVQAGGGWDFIKDPIFISSFVVMAQWVQNSFLSCSSLISAMSGCVKLITCSR